MPTTVIPSTPGVPIKKGLATKPSKADNPPRNSVEQKEYFQAISPTVSDQHEVVFRQDYCLRVVFSRTALQTRAAEDRSENPA
jgi:hypothetical protein